MAGLHKDKKIDTYLVYTRIKKHSYRFGVNKSQKVDIGPVYTRI